MKKKTLLQEHKELINQITDEYIKKIFYYICIGEVDEITPLSCENLMRKYIEMQNKGGK